MNKLFRTSKKWDGNFRPIFAFIPIIFIYVTKFYNTLKVKNSIKLNPVFRVC
nr:MAG TPA: hypothetical protein [Caudoviricetes sp.]